MDVVFWGVRGSIAVSGPDFGRTGGNTSCVEVRYGEHRLVFDGGTGLRALGAQHPDALTDTVVLFSHVHWDHIQGVPFFAPAYRPDNEVLFCGTRRARGELREALASQMRPPTFPIGLDDMRAHKAFIELSPGAARSIGPFVVQVAELSHPQGCVAYRVEAGGRSVVYATDHEAAGKLNDALVALSRGCDLLLHDAQFTDDEIAGRVGPSRRGWGHSTWTDAVRAAEAADVAKLALFHHDPQRTDDAVAVIEAQARGRFARAFAAREQQVVAL